MWIYFIEEFSVEQTGSLSKDMVEKVKPHYAARLWRLSVHVFLIFLLLWG